MNAIWFGLEEALEELLCGDWLAIFDR